MAIDKLSLYNRALGHLGQRRLSSLTEDREPRYQLDAAFDLGAIEYCLEICTPTFASKVAPLSSGTISSDHGLDQVHVLPSDFVKLMAVYSDSKLDQEVTRYILSNGTIACEYATLYVRYSSDDHVTDFTNWTVAFANVVAAYLARETAPKLASDEYERVNALFIDRVEIVKQLNAEDEGKRSAGTHTTLTNAWRNIFNDALFIMGLDEIVSNTDDSNRRMKLTNALSTGIVEDQLEDVGWTFATVTTKIQYNPSIDPSWGYQRAHDKPADMHRIDGVFTDEYMNNPLKYYADEGDVFLCDYDEIYLSYVSSNFLTTPDNWPAFFKKLIAARLAKETSASLRNEGADPERANESYRERRVDAKNNDAVQSPPRIISRGSWSRAFGRGGSCNGRPGSY